MQREYVYSEEDLKSHFWMELMELLKDDGISSELQSHNRIQNVCM